MRDSISKPIFVNTHTVLSERIFLSVVLGCMMRITIICFSALLLLSCNRDLRKVAENAQNTIPNTLSVENFNFGWRLLFDGKTADGWRGFNSVDFPESWTVQDGMLIALGNNGQEGQDIITTKKYEDFILSLEWKLTKGANSGILYRVDENSHKNTYETGPEYQLIDETNFPEKLEDWQKTGANYAMHPAKGVMQKPSGEWNHTVIIVKGTEVMHYLNSVLILQYKIGNRDWQKRKKSGKWGNYSDYGTITRGHIALQNHGNKVYFRSIKIKEL